MYSQDDYFKLLGKISVLFATLDFFVTEVILKIEKNEVDDFDLPRKNATLGNKLRFLQDLKISSEFGLKTIRSLSYIFPEAIAISDERNRYIHDIWIFEENSISNGVIDRVRLTSSGLKERSSLSIDEIKEFEIKVKSIQHPFVSVLNATSLSSLRQSPEPKR